jgi:hypothetical protein
VSSVQYAVLNQHPNAITVLEWITQHDLLHQVHLNRTRFWVPLDSPLYTEFALRFATICFTVLPDPELIDSQDC